MLNFQGAQGQNAYYNPQNPPNGPNQFYRATNTVIKNGHFTAAVYPTHPGTNGGAVYG